MTDGDDEFDPIIHAGDQGVVMPEEFGEEMYLDERGIVQIKEQTDNHELDEFDGGKR